MNKIRAELFASRYVKFNCNGARALRSLGHKGSPGVLWTTAWRLLRSVEVQEALAGLRKEMDMDALEVVARMSEMARASIEDFLSKDNHIDTAQGRRRGELHLLKRYRERVLRTTTQESGVREEVIERDVWLHDAQAALKTMMEYHGLLSDILELRKVPKDPQELRQFIKDRLPQLFSTMDPKKVN